MELITAVNAIGRTQGVILRFLGREQVTAAVSLTSSLC